MLSLHFKASTATISMHPNCRQLVLFYILIPSKHALASTGVLECFRVFTDQNEDEEGLYETTTTSPVSLQKKDTLQ